MTAMIHRTTTDTIHYTDFYTDRDLCSGLFIVMTTWLPANIPKSLYTYQMNHLRFPLMLLTFTAIL